MTSLLHLDASANRTDESVSRQLTALFADGWRTLHGSVGYRYRDLVADPAPPLNTAYCRLGRRLERDGLVPPSEVGAMVECSDEAREWALTQPLLAELLAADTVLIGAPMYNFSISASLKAWIDRVSFPCAFAERRLSGKRIVVISASGGAYGPGTPREGWDFQTPYLRAYFSENGVAEQDMHVIKAEMTLADFVPQLADFRPLAASSLSAARDAVTRLVAAERTRSARNPALLQ